MIKLLKIICVSFIAVSLSNCSKVLETIELEINTADRLVQEEFYVVEKTLTISEAKKHKSAPYKRMVLQSGRGTAARSIPESEAIKSVFPDGNQPFLYKIGIGDTLSFSRLIENNGLGSNALDQWPNELENSAYKLGIGDGLTLTRLKESTVSQVTPNGDDESFILNSQTNEVIESTGSIGSDGSLLLLEVGRIQANGKTLNELRSEVRNIFIRNGIGPRFQLEIVKFKSQKAYLSINGSSQVIILDNKKTTLRDILTSAEVGFKPGVITRIILQRSGKNYTMLLRQIFSERAREVKINADDHIFVEDSSEKVITNVSVVGQDGYLVFQNWKN